MSEPRVVSLGKVTVRDGDVVIQPEPLVDVRARAGEEVVLALFYDYREGSHDKERVHLHLRARLAGRPDATGETSLEDRPVVADDRRGWFSVPVRAPESGTLDGVADVRGEYSTRPWVGGGDRTELPVRATVHFRLRVG